VAGPLPAVRASRPVLGQIVANLLTNAVKFVAPGTAPLVRIAAGERDGRVRLTVEDNGIGIEKPYRERIFNVFERLHGQEHFSGTGIGLAIVRKGAERLGGAAGVEGGDGGGSRFWVELQAVGQGGAG
jgi:signal transduction histidine kinase